jgi:hypothetical protein
MKRPIPPELIKKTKDWLGPDGHQFFNELLEVHGTVNACWDEGGIPHPVHFREGMQIRNFMRTSNMCDDWDAHDFDDNWVELIEKALKEV